ncbi:UNVERIFIED_ORG: hypothetical protein ABRZ91_001832 [Heyndrickxia coagulans]
MKKSAKIMLFTIIGILLFLWVVGIVSFYSI